jgi:MoaA/NifB/PqqE/SkfB family radical SAM enzyme
MVNHLLRLAAEYLKPGISMDVWQRCNIHCVFCPSFVKKNVESALVWSADNVKKIISESDKICSVYLAGSFGEPILNPDLPEIVRYLAGNGVHVSVSTNGQALTPALAQKLIEAGVRHFNISSVGFNMAVTEKYMRGIQFERTLTNISQVAELARKKGVHIGISIVGVIEAILNLDETLEFARANRIADIRLLSILDSELSHTGKQDNPAYRAFIEGNSLFRDKELYRERWRRAEKRAKDLGISLTVNDPYKSLLEFTGGRDSDMSDDETAAGQPGNGNSRLCLDPFVSAIVTWDGSVVPCCAESSWAVGNLSRVPFSEIWNHGEHFQVRRGLLEGRLHPMCEPCGRAPRVPAEFMRLYLALRILEQRFDPGLLWYVSRRRKMLKSAHARTFFRGVPGNLAIRFATVPGLGRELFRRLRQILVRSS